MWVTGDCDHGISLNECVFRQDVSCGAICPENDNIHESSSFKHMLHH